MQEDISVILFAVDNYRLLLPIDDIRYIIRSTALGDIPDAPSYIAGAVNYHGEILPVVDLRQKFGLPVKKITIHQYYAVIENKNLRYAIIIDEIIGLHVIPKSSMQEAPMKHFSESMIIAAVQIEDKTAYAINTAKVLQDITIEELRRKISETERSTPIA